MSTIYSLRNDNLCDSNCKSFSVTSTLDDTPYLYELCGTIKTTSYLCDAAVDEPISEIPDEGVLLGEELGGLHLVPVLLAGLLQAELTQVHLHVLWPGVVALQNPVKMSRFENAQEENLKMRKMRYSVMYFLKMLEVVIRLIKYTAWGLAVDLL